MYLISSPSSLHTDLHFGVIIPHSHTACFIKLAVKVWDLL